jgi:hypothetical protein
MAVRKVRGAKWSGPETAKEVVRETGCTREDTVVKCAVDTLTQDSNKETSHENAASLAA